VPGPCFGLSELRSPIAAAATATAAATTTATATAATTAGATATAATAAAAAVAAAAATPTAGTAATAATLAGTSLFGFVHSKGAAFEICAVHGFHRFACVIGSRHLYESKTARTSGFAVQYQLHFSDLTELGEGVL
jgi:hypothetical protein